MAEICAVFESVFGEGEQLVFVVGRGHNGTRVAAQLLQRGGLFMGAPLNGSMDLTPHSNTMYRAAQLAGTFVQVDGRSYETALFSMEPPKEFRELVFRYLQQGELDRRVLDGFRAGFKLPETTLCYPWLVRMFPKAAYLLWGRDPRGTIRTPHGTDNLSEWGVQGWPGDLSPGRARALSWATQARILLDEPTRPTRSVWTSLERYCLDPLGVRNQIREVLGLDTGEVEPQRHIIEKWNRSRPVALGSVELDLAIEVHRRWEHRQGWSLL